MTVKQPDLRAVRTDKAIRKAFEDMIMAGDRPIKVTELAKRAGINRKTFYLHYDTVDDLIDSYVADAKADLLNRLRKHSVDNYVRHRGLLIQVLSDFYTANQQFYAYILQLGDDTGRVRHLEAEITEIVARQIADAEHISMDDAMLVVTFSSSTILAMLRLKTAGKVHFSVAEMQSKIAALNVGGLKAMGNLPI